MRVLIYGFGPYRRYKNNVTEKIVRALANREGLKTIVFPVRFHKPQFIRAIERHRPAIILGLGQCSSGRLLRVEQFAVNRRRANKREKLRTITPGGAGRLRTDLRLELGQYARSSRNAGDFVCNYSMYIVLEHLMRHQGGTRSGFIHIPRRYDSAKACRLLQRALAKLDGSAPKNR